MQVFIDGTPEGQKIDGARRLLEAAGWFVVAPPERAPAGCSANYDPRVWQLMELATELNRRIGQMVQR
jgi:hypothetical protein